MSMPLAITAKHAFPFSGSCKSQARGGLCLAGVDALRRALLVGFANRLARRMPRHNGYKTLNERATLAQLHPASARIAADEDGLMPEFVIYYALFATAKVFLSKVGPFRQ